MKTFQGAMLALTLVGAWMVLEGGDPMFGETTQPGPSFTWAELTKSNTAVRLRILNTPGQRERDNLRRLVTETLQPLRNALGRPVHVTNAYRSRALNLALGGSDTSQHMTGEAADIRVDGMSAEQLATFIVRSGIRFDQVIAYAPELGGHVHISYSAPARAQTLWSPRKKVYQARSYA